MAGGSGGGWGGAGRGGAGGGFVPLPPAQAIVGGGAVIAGGFGVLGLPTKILLSIIAGGSGGTAHPPGDDGDDFTPPKPDDLGPRWKPQDPADSKCWTGCEKVAKQIQRKLGGGQIYRIS
ncbi:hypothetical protein GCM10009804_37190 [Kribbella hippodromi]|uniref:Uncharacterized protein n=1 Tax=Kribbella hippodromi TaxID=434347 RepID=A0ABP4PEY7_9ACTN